MTRAERRAVLVTGGALRVGAALVRRFAAEGRAVIIHYRQADTAAVALQAEIRAAGGVAHVLGADLADSDAVAGLIPSALKLAPDLGVLVNSASVFEPDSAVDPQTDGWVSSTVVNALAPARLAAALHAATTGGVVIHILDQKLANPNPDYFSYTASKAALAEAARMQAMAFGDRTRVICLAPGLMLPSGDQTDEEYARSATMNLLRRRTTPEDLAEAAALAASGALASGETLFVDGGQHLTPQSRDVMFLVRGET